MAPMHGQKAVEAAQEPGSAGTLAGMLPVEWFAGKGAGAPRVATRIAVPAIPPGIPQLRYWLGAPACETRPSAPAIRAI